VSLGNGPGITPKTVTVGMFYATGADKYQAALGGGAAKSGDLKADAEAVAHDINSHGGLAGRRLEIVFHTVDASDTTPAAAQSQAACASFTQDHHVLLALEAVRPVTPSDNFTPCMAKAGSVVTGVEANLADRDFARLPAYYDVSALATDHVAANLVDALVNNRYFTGWDTTNGQPGAAPVKVGILAPDKADWKWVVPHVLVPELAKRGIKVAPSDVVIWHFPEATSGDGQAVSEIQGAVLKFRSDGVTHVLPVEQNSMAFFASQAEGQHYRPRYGIDSYSAMQIYAGTLVPYAQMTGAVGVGWSPQVDLPTSMTTADTGPYAGPGRAHCMKVMKDAGISFSAATDKANALVICDALYSAQRAVDAIPTGTSITAASYMAAVEGFGPRFPIAVLPAASYGQGRHYPVIRGWAYGYVPGCQCMHYSGKPYALR
jgi:hypothetical protein